MPNYASPVSSWAKMAQAEGSQELWERASLALSPLPFSFPHPATELIVEATEQKYKETPILVLSSVFVFLTVY